MRQMWVGFGLGVIAFAAIDAPAMTFQPAPRGSDGSVQLVDPDAEGDRMAERMRSNDMRAYGRRALTAKGLLDQSGDRWAPLPSAMRPFVGLPY